MKVRSKQRFILFSIVFSSFILFLNGFNNFIIYYNNSKVNKFKELTSENLIPPRKSAYWNENDVKFIHIFNDNWSAADLNWIQNATGTLNDPHRIENVTIDAFGAPTGCGILIENSNDYFIIQNCTVFNSSAGASNAGIKLDNAHNGTLINNNCSNNKCNGIYIYLSENNTITGNIANNNSYYGILLADSNNNTIQHNKFSHNGKVGSASGISLSTSHNNTILNNTANGNNDHGIQISVGSSFNRIINNTFTYNDQNGIYMLTNSKNNIITGNNASYNSITSGYNGIYLMNSHENSISDNMVFNNSYGIYGYQSNLNKVYNNTVAYNKNHGISTSNCNRSIFSNNTIFKNKNDGMRILGSSFNNISNNRVIYNDYRGIYLLTNSNNNTIVGNNVSYNTLAGIYHGIYLDDSSNNSILENYVKDCDWGIYIHTTSNNKVINNTVVLCDNNGIFLNDNQFISVLNNKVLNNNQHGIALSNSNKTTIFNNRVESNIGTGIRLDQDSESNLIFQNYISGNGLNGLDDGNFNDWNKSAIGNYWGNYTDLGGAAVDANDDGIGDINYPISGLAESQDFHPLWHDTDDVAPTIIINTPGNYTPFYNAPTITITVYDFYSINSTWYMISGTSQNITFIGNSITINKTLWKGLTIGTYRIRFYVNDSVGHTSYRDILVIKTSVPSVTANGDDKKDKKDDSDLNYYFLLLFIIIFSVIGVSIPIIYMVQTSNHKATQGKKIKRINKDDYFDNKKLLDIFSGENILEKIKANSDLRITFISEEFFEKLNYFDWIEQDLNEFIEEMLELSPEIRMSILDEMIQVSKFVNKRKKKGWGSYN